MSQNPEGTSPPIIHSLDDYREKSNVESRTYSGGSGGGGGKTVDAETQRYVDSNMRAVKAENSTNFARLEAKIDGIKPGASWQQNAGVMISGIVVTLGLVFGVLAYASDRFDSGVSAMGAIEESLDAQREINAEQDSRLDRIIGALEATSENSQGGATD